VLSLKSSLILLAKLVVNADICENEIELRNYNAV
jgi:hypothetical protein